ncbi:MAG TPA: hypothetical protein PLC99_03460 [Verrucomicrobiota bacterium]|nr:hypothetical protein [Verrucomicrobiota bacterium]
MKPNILGNHHCPKNGHGADFRQDGYTIQEYVTVLIDRGEWSFQRELSLQTVARMSVRQKGNCDMGRAERGSRAAKSWQVEGKARFWKS